jgi:LysM repeat protein
MQVLEPQLSQPQRPTLLQEPGWLPEAANLPCKKQSRRKPSLPLRWVAGLLVLLVGAGSAFAMMVIESGSGSKLQAQATGCLYYTVRPGDVLWRIAFRYGSSVMAIARASGIRNPNLIYPNQRLCVPHQGATSGAAQTATWNAMAWDNVSVQNMIIQQFGIHAQAALNVARCESSFQPYAYNPTPVGWSHAEGVFQILYPDTWSLTPQRNASPYNAAANIAAAYYLSHGGTDWHLWECQP